MTRRIMGKLAFVTLRDASGTIQLYCDKGRMDGGADTMKALKNLVDAGDFVGAKGGLRRTDKGELSVVVDTLQVRFALMSIPDVACSQFRRCSASQVWQVAAMFVCRCSPRRTGCCLTSGTACKTLRSATGSGARVAAALSLTH